MTDAALLPPDSAADFEARLRQIGAERYHDKHPFHQLQLVKRVFVVITLGPDLAQAGFEIGCAVGGQKGGVCHSSSSMPSAVICHPWASASARSGPSGCKIGLVLLMWI